MQFSVKQARKYAGLTQDQMRIALNISRTTYSNMEKDPSIITLGQLNKISKITGVPIKNFILTVNTTAKVERIFQENE